MSSHGHVINPIQITGFFDISSIILKRLPGYFMHPECCSLSNHELSPCNCLAQLIAEEHLYHNMFL